MPLEIRKHKLRRMSKLDRRAAGYRRVMDVVVSSPRPSEATMSIFLHRHGNSVFSYVFHTLKVWHDRSVQRAELSALGERDLHDIGLSTSAVSGEIRKPFWRA